MANTLSRRWFWLKPPQGLTLACALFVGSVWVAVDIILFSQMSTDEMRYMPALFWVFMIAAPPFSLWPYFTASVRDE